MIIYFAGVDSNNFLEMLIGTRVKNVLCSYWNITNGKPTAIRDASFLGRIMKLGFRNVIDSGAFSFMATAKKKGELFSSKDAVADEYKHAEFDVFMTAYLAWVEKNWALITDYIELDIQKVVGLDRVKSWRKLIKERGLMHKCWTCYHSGDSWEDFVEMVEEAKVENGGSGHVGIEGMIHHKIPYAAYYNFAEHCYKQGVCIHVFATTTTPFLIDNPVTSADSTSWIMSGKYGKGNIFDPTLMMLRSAEFNLRLPSQKQMVRRRTDVLAAVQASLRLYATDMPARERIDKAYVFNTRAAEAYVDMQEALTEMWVKRGFDWAEITENIKTKKEKLYGN